MQPSPDLWDAVPDPAPVISYPCCPASSIPLTFRRSAFKNNFKHCPCLFVFFFLRYLITRVTLNFFI